MRLIRSDEGIRSPAPFRKKPACFAYPPRKFRTLGAGGKKDIEELEPIDQVPRTLSSPDTGEGTETS